MGNRRPPEFPSLDTTEVASGDLIPVWDTSAGQTKTVDAQFFIGAENIFDVSLWDAVGAGVDESAEIQQCINDAGPGAAILFPPVANGYIATGLNIVNDNVVLMFSGYGSRIRKPANGTIFNVTGNGFNALNMYLSAASNLYTGPNISISGLNALLVDCVSGGTAGVGLLATGDGVWVRGGRYGGMTIDGATQIDEMIITGARITSPTGGINSTTLNNIKDGLFSGNMVDGAFVLGPTVTTVTSGCAVSGNVFRGTVDINGVDNCFSGNAAYAVVQFRANSGNNSWTGNAQGPACFILNAGSPTNTIIRQIGAGSVDDPWRLRYGADFAEGVAQFEILWGTGDPQGRVAASPPSVYYNMSGTATPGESAMYVKEAGIGSNTGWVGK